MPWITKPCEFCSKEFTSQSWKGYERKFCSNSCKQKDLIGKNKECFFGRNDPFSKRMDICKECGKEFWKKRIEKIFCNNDCYLTWVRKNTTRKLLKCSVCGIERLRKIKEKLNKIEVCSKECRDKYYLEFRKKNMHRRTQASESIKLFGNDCEKCGKKDNVECHHLDCNPRNNPLDGSNWMRLCVSCHKIVHSVIKYNKSFLSRDDILNLEIINHKCGQRISKILWEKTKMKKERDLLKYPPTFEENVEFMKNFNKNWKLQDTINYATRNWGSEEVAQAARQALDELGIKYSKQMHPFP